MPIKIAALLAWSLASSTICLASHNTHGRRIHNLTQLELNHLAVEQMPPACNLPACVGLGGTITCIISAVTSGDAAALERCLSSGLTEICSCAACIPPVMDFLTSLGVCVTSPGNSPSEAVEHVGATFTASPTTSGHFVTSTITVTPNAAHTQV